jgi:hypothetical protein
MIPFHDSSPVCCAVGLFSCNVSTVHGHGTCICQGGEKRCEALVLAAISIGRSSWISFLPQATPEKAYKKGHRRYARGLKFCMLWMSAILPTTGPAKVKEEAKAEGAGFDLTDGGGSTDHG